MADNLVATISQYLTPDLQSKIAAALGLDASTATKAFGAAVPAILSSLGAVAATPGGAAKLSDAISNQDLGALDSLGKTLESDSPMAMIESGTSTLGALVGNGGISALTGAISKFSGADADTSGSVIGMMAPIVTGVIAQQDPASWSSAAGITSFFASQKSNISAALPNGVGALLGGAGLAGIAGAARSTITQATAAPAQAQAAIQEAKGGIPTWLLIVGAIIIAFLAWHFLGKSGDKSDVAKIPAATTAQPAAPSAPQLDVAAITKGVTGQLDGLKASLGSITDVASAKAALPQLAASTSDLGKLTGIVGTLPAAGKTAVTSLFGAALPALKAQIDKVEAIPGVGEVTKPTLDGLAAKLEALSK